ncbi:gliding motility-associated C-terminal domain-containing protein [uncultured Fluviicola sp.]|uniref:T9SS type B sorting domain-containing protein n=1 Tax=uncultured Fluviicola sp. TaxID=463303 RepID=UPI0025D6DC6A|nr:gliding motility-associated C-terminal domain-containing protein [uncultured Fluviicola sp.]
MGQQNLILNGDFEEYWQCPDDATQIERCKYVYNPCESALSTSDYFNACYVSGSGGAVVGVPNTPFGYQEAYSGNGMVGFGSEYNSSNQFEYDEYIQLSFSEKLECGKKYRFVGHFNLADYCRYSIKNIGFYFSETELNDSDFLYNIYTPQYIDSSTLIEDTLKWYTLSFEFVAQRAYKYVSIGHFKKDSSLSFIEVNPNSIFGFSAYFYLDGCSLSKVEEDNDVEIEIPNIFTPNNDGINDFFEIKGNKEQFEKVYVVNRWGNEIVELLTPFKWDGLSKSGTVVSEGVYYYICYPYSECEVDRKSLFNGMIHLIR